LAGKPGRIKEDRHNPPYKDCAPKLQLTGVFDYRSNNTDQYASAATPAEAGIVITQA
jgi:hypothetical protein